MPVEIQNMSPWQRLDAILREGTLRAFPPFGTTRPCICLSESPFSHLIHLIVEGEFAPWGIVVTRDRLLAAGGGSVAYVPTLVRDAFARAGLEHWAVRTEDGSWWMHQREWRLPTPPGAPSVLLSPLGVKAVLIGDLAWRPTRVMGSALDEATGELRHEPELPTLWRVSETWVWDHANRTMVAYPPGTLC
ncbi:hypothetical protein ACWGJW_39495 [Streptomyces nigrescens]